MEYEKLGLLHDMFRRQAALTPDLVAVVDADGRQMTFRELDDVTDAVGINLQYKGVRPDGIVGIYMKRRLEYVIAYIAILKAGGAYMTVDPSYPPTLLDDIMEDSQPVAILTEYGLETQIPNAKNVILCEGSWVDQIRSENVEFSKTRTLPAEKPDLDNLAYVVYSSGSTGKPKGIACPHRGAVFSYHWRHEEYPYSDGDREACNIFFVWEMLRPMLKGIPMYIIPDTVIYDPKLLGDFIFRNKITRILFTPSLLETVINTTDIRESFQSLKELVFCGEVVTTILLDRCLKALPNCQIINLYSVSEAHDISCSDLTQWVKDHPSQFLERKFCSVGKLLPSVTIFIMDDQLNVQPVGVSGEMYVSTPGLARGYLNRPALNAERFIQRPSILSPQYGERLYKTGDWGYMMSDGTFEICGRCDTMVKIRGYSVEKQAIEAYLLELPMVNSCIVLVHGEEGEDKSLVAYVVPEGKTTKTEIRAELKKLLPFYMIPTYFVFLSSIPVLVPAGKLDKKALPPVHDSDELAQELSQCTQTEQTLIPMWREVLKLKSLDIQESFFDMGGHSLLATKLVTMVTSHYDITLSVADVFMHSTITAMGKLIDSRLSNGEATPPPEEVDLMQEAERHDQKITSLDIQLRAFWRSTQFSDRWDNCRILLTGCTGFLGSFILRDLLLKTKTHIFCLVREGADKNALERVKLSLIKYGILESSTQNPTSQQQHIAEILNTRLSTVTGDVALAHLGMSLDDYQYLSTEIDVVIHAAAYVNLIYPYQMLYGPNVLGTQNVISFACSSKVKPLHYISTDAVFPHGLQDCSEDADMLSYPTQLTDGYAKSKWVAEQLVIRAMNRGMPVAIYRPGNLSGESQDGFWNPQDFTLLMIQGCLETGTAPVLDWNVDMTPVDFVSSFIVTLIQKMSLGLGKVYHLVNPNPIKSAWLFEWITAHGYMLKMIDYQTWIQRLQKHSQEAKTGLKLKGLVDNMASDSEFFNNLSSYKQDNVSRVLSVIKSSYPQINFALLNTYFHKLRSRRVLPSLRKNTTLDHPLSGQVAIVTGASSGIGAAIALHLCRAGAKVALAARRVDKMSELRSAIQAEDGVAICVKTDVTDRKQVQELVSHTESTLGPVDILVNNAGIMYYTKMKNLRLDEWETQVDLNCKGVLNCIGATLDGMISRQSGHIINMSSDAGRRGFAGLAVYSGTKFFVEGLSQGMRHELSDQGVKVTCIQPGDVKTELFKHTTDTEARDQYDGSSSNRILDPEDIAKAVVYAASQPKHCAINEILIEPKTAPI